MTSTSKRLTFLALLTMLLILFKLFKILHWSWGWIMAPLWVPTVLGIIFYITLAKYMDRKNAKSNKWKKMFDEVREESRNF